MSMQKEEGKKPFKPRYIQKEEGDREDKILMIEVDHFMMADRDKILDRHKIDKEMVIEEELVYKITAEMIVEIEIDTISEETLAMLEIDQGKEAPHLEEVLPDVTTVQI